MKKNISVLTILGSPNDQKSNTRAYLEDFLDKLKDNGVSLTNNVVSLGSIDIQPCKGCWVCTKGKACPIKDDLGMLKKAMVECDMLILASPVYANQVSAQMKAFFDRLFTWLHVFPMIGKYGMTVVSTGNDGIKETGDYLEKMMACLGISSFGTISGSGAFTPGFWPRRKSESEKNGKMAEKVAGALKTGTLPSATVWNKKMFAVMKKKLVGINLTRHIGNVQAPSSPVPPKALMKLVAKGMEKHGVKLEDTQKLTSLMSFEYDWWVDRSWYHVKNFAHLSKVASENSFDIAERLLHK